jgi:hypothetical protein
VEGVELGTEPERLRVRIARDSLLDGVQYCPHDPSLAGRVFKLKRRNLVRLVQAQRIRPQLTAVCMLYIQMVYIARL